MNKRSLSIFLTCFAILIFSGTSRAEMFTANLSGAQENPPVSTTATGYARVLLNEAAGTITFTVVFNGLSSNQTASHIHAPAPIGSNIGVAIDFGAVGGTSGTITGTRTITPTQIAQLRAHLGYVNVHSANFGGGEIRGQLGAARPVDNDGDGRTDFSVLRFPNIPPPGIAPIQWWNLNSTSGVNVFPEFGNANTDFPAPGDYDGDGRNDIAVYRAGATVGAQSDFFIVFSSNNVLQHYAWGVRGDQPVQRDYDGDGLTDVAVLRPGAASTAATTWFIRNSATNTARIEFFGLTGNGTTSFDTPVPGDYDGDGKFDIAVYRFGQSPANNFIVKRSSDGAVTFTPFGNFNSDWITPGDYDGDGKTDFCAVRVGALVTSPMTWWILQSSNGAVRVQVFGRGNGTGISDVPAQGDYDGDARTDIAVYRTGATAASASFYWSFNSFTNSTQVTTWGLGSDFPVNRFDTR